MAQKIATSSSDITGDIGNHSSRSAGAPQIFTDEQGNSDHHQKFSPGWSNSPARAIIKNWSISSDSSRAHCGRGTTVKGLASANGAGTRWRPGQRFWAKI